MVDSCNIVQLGIDYEDLVKFHNNYNETLGFWDVLAWFWVRRAGFVRGRVYSNRVIVKLE